MTVPSWAIVVGLIGALVGPYLSYRAAGNKSSGQVRSSEATDLWAESSAIRKDLSAQLIDARDRMGRAEERIMKLEGKNEALLEENRKLRQDFTTATTKIDELERENAVLRTRITDLTRAVNGT